MFELDRYLTGIAICLIMLIPYACFRGEVFKEIHERGIRSREIYKRMTGFVNWLWYRGLDRSFGCRMASVLAIISSFLLPLVTVYYSSLGWWEVMPPLALQIPVIVLGVFTSVMVGYTVVSRNYRLFESPFIFFGAIRIRNVRGNFLNTAYYSVILDFLYILLPTVLPGILFFL